MATEDRIEELLAQVLDRLEEGDSDALADVCAQHPEHAEGLRSRFENLRKLDLVAGDDAPVEPPGRIGGFRLIERLGGGGMGVVYRAEDEALGREVALKLIRPDQLHSADIRERFRRETGILAQMQHPCIVPVHSVGTEGGVPWFVMEYIRGATLQEVLNELSGRHPTSLSGRDFHRAVVRCTPDADETAAGAYLFDGTWEETCLRIAAQICDALAHAYERGVLHRDIKPSNVMVTPEGRVFLLDFGLSLFEGTERITLTQAPVGSLLYMPPELVERQGSVDAARSDVYALGMTLQELLTLRSPFDSTSAPGLLLQIAKGDRRRLRELNPDASWEAETVCETAMELDPGRRYANAAELGNDLRNVLEHRPIEARRAGALLRLRRLVQRRPTASVAVVLGSLLVVGGPLVYAWQQQRAGQEIAAVNEDLEEALGKAESNFDMAFEAVQVMLERVGDEDLENVPQVQEVREELLGLAQNFYGRLHESAPEDVRLRHALATAGIARGRVLELIGRRSEAVEMLGAGIARLEQLVTEHPDELVYRQQLATVLIRLGRIQHMAGATDGSAAAYARAEELLAKSEHGDDAERAWARSSRDALRTGRAMLQIKQNDPDTALATYAETLESARAELAADPENLDLKSLVGALLNDFARIVFRRHDDAAAAEEMLIEAQELRAEVFTARPGDQTAMSNLFDTCLNLAAAQERLGKLDEAELSLDVGFEVAEELRSRFPSVPTYGSALADAHITMGVIRHARGDVEGAVEEQLVAIELLDALFDELPDDPEVASALGVALSNLGYIQNSLGRFPAAEKLLLRAIEAHEHSCRLVPEHPEYRAFVALALHNLIFCHLRQAKHVEIPAFAERVAELQPRGAKSFFDLACFLSESAELARRDPTLDPARADETARDYLGRGRAYLERSLAIDPEAQGRSLDDPRLAPLETEELRAAE